MLSRRHSVTKHYQDHLSLPYGVRIFAWVRAIRWVGWGLGEALLPVFILLFSKTFAEMGLFSSTVDIVSLISLPIIGLWADKVPAKRLVLCSLLLCPLVGINYFIAGELGMTLFIVLARMVNGFTWELENIGIETYYRRITNCKTIATSFGYLDTWSHVTWIGAALIGMFLVLFMPIHYLLLGIAPFAIVAYAVALKAPKDSVRAGNDGETLSFIRSYGKAIGKWWTWNARLWLIGALVLFSGIVSALMYFFIPIDAYLSGASLPMVVLITVFGAIPALFGYKLGRIADVRNKYTLVSLGLVGVAVIAVGLVVFPQYWFKLIAIFLMGIILELLYVIQSSVITLLGPSETYGERGSAFECLVTLGDLAAPLILGIGLDIMGFANLSLVIASVALTLCVGYVSADRDSRRPDCPTIASAR
jgi:MFS family permease